MTLPEIWYKPLEIVTDVLTSQKTYLNVQENLPDKKLLDKF